MDIGEKRLHNCRDFVHPSNLDRIQTFSLTVDDKNGPDGILFVKIIHFFFRGIGIKKKFREIRGQARLRLFPFLFFLRRQMIDPFIFLLVGPAGCPAFQGRSD